MMEAGEVFRWIDFPWPRDGDIKPRWFIILGTTSTITPPICLHLCTTTTQLTYYQPGGNRCKNIFHSFKKGEFGFEDDCILDIDYDYYYLPQQDYEKSIDKIESKGKLDKDTMKQIYNKILKSKFYSTKVKRDIHTSFNNAGVYGLPKP